MRLIHISQCAKQRKRLILKLWLPSKSRQTYRCMLASCRIVTAHCPWKLIGMKWQAWGLHSAVHCNKAPEQNIYVSLAKWQQMISVFQLDGGTWNGCDKHAWAGNIMKCKCSGSGSELGQWGRVRVGRRCEGGGEGSRLALDYIWAYVYYQLTAMTYGEWCHYHARCARAHFSTT